MSRLSLIGSSSILVPVMVLTIKVLLVIKALPPVRVILPLVVTVIRAG